MSRLVVAEKPSVARDIARVVGAHQSAEGYLEGNGHLVTWAIGHLVGLAEPQEIDPGWRRWRLDVLPMLPERWPLVVLPKTKRQFQVVAKLMRSRAVKEIVCATDAGREGELIFRLIYEAAGANKPVRRLWISSLTPDAVRDGFRRLEDGARYDALGAAARGRARADWLVGMNLSRAYTLVAGDLCSVGRVQTPTLALVVAREKEIQRFVPEDYLEVVAEFGRPEGGYRGTWFDPQVSEAREGRGRASRLPPDGELAGRIVARVRAAARGEIQEVEAEERRMAPPLLYDLTELQRHANRLFGFSAKKTLEVAQALYESKKLISYPRTDSRHLSTEIAATLDQVVSAVAHRYPGLLAPGTGQRPLGRRFVDDRKVSDHHAILPTAADARAVSLNGDEQRIYDLICRRLLAAWHDDHVWRVTRVVTVVRSEEAADHFRSSGSAVVQPGWKVLELGGKSPGKGRREGEEEDDQTLPAGLARGLATTVDEVRAEARQTRPPRRYTEATLLTAMETAGRQIEDDELSRAMRDRGLGTPATRASIIETLLAREYLRREQKSLVATERGIQLIDTVHPDVKSPILTADWEAKLHAIERGEETLERFMAGIEQWVRDQVGVAVASAPEGPKPRARSARAEGSDGAGAAHRARAAHRPPEVATSGDPAAASGAPARRERRQRGEDGANERARPARVRASEPDGASIGRERDPKGARASRETGERAAERGGEPQREQAWAHAAERGRQASTRGSELGLDHAWVNAPEHDRPGPSEQASAPAPERGRLPGAPRAAARQSTSAQPPEQLSLAPAVERGEAAARLEPLLREVFGHPGFRPHQAAVCRAAAAGRDVLLVMPTGAGKSLCYQLPGLARGGPTLVISPLIALMQDQVSQLAARGLRAEAIHSGRGRGESRAALAAYLAGELQYLYVAPERLAVPGFVEALTRRIPALVAVDEAHCISHWGHDFRPDYRKLAARLAPLRPAPFMALTATATPRVQGDIVAELGLPRPERFIHGFRRVNIGIEAVEVPRSARADVAAQLLQAPERRPAIVYAPTRKEAEALGARLGKRRRAATYHAGMPAAEREAVQAAFAAGRLDVVVATIAFGMGIDKADVRTVIHLALPQSLEGYYQEIGRAGRDGAPSRAFLLHGFADRRLQAYWVERSYPEPDDLARIWDLLGPEPLEREELRHHARLEAELFERALEQLWVHGGATLDASDRVARGPDPSWRRAYQAQRAHRIEQAEAVERWAKSHGCRMVGLIRHFGDEADSGTPCGICDACAPVLAEAQPQRRPEPAEAEALGRILEQLKRRPRAPSGALFRAAGEGSIDRGDYERLLSALARAGWVEVRDTSFQRGAETITYAEVGLTELGASRSPADLAQLRVPAAIEASAKPRRKRRERITSNPARQRAKGAPARERSTDAPARKRASGAPRPRKAKAESTGSALEEALRRWRRATASQRRVPAYRIMPDRVLIAVASTQPRTAEALSDLPGVGPVMVSRHGAEILSLVERHGFFGAPAR